MSDPSSRAVGHLDAAGLRARLDAGGPLVLLDVREPFERAIAAIGPTDSAVAVAIPMGEVPAHLDEIAAVAARGPIVVYCHHGQRSMVVARWLAARGISGLANLDGGIDAWSTDVDPSTPRY